MPTITSRLAWALAVDPAEVIARVNEEVQYRLTANTLRLCHVFGRGDHATITKLPKELIDLIEECLNAKKLDGAARSVEVAKNARRCFTKACVPYRDHFSDEQKLDIINRELRDRERPAAKSLDEDRVEELAEWIMGNELDRINEVYSVWNPEHEENIKDWRWLIGTPAEAEPDALSNTREADFILRYYGLELCIGSRQQSLDWGSYDTLAYLALPDTNGEHLDDVMVDDCGTGYVGCSVPAEEALIAYEVTVPPTPTASQSARFGRMLAKLGVSGWEPASSDEERERQRKRAEPKLMMLAKIVRYG
ncbi:hypothetical protein LTR10_003632 [Elasticomyces elasticus]|nr:hypothetical protein LTR10_003632 [Elasticomyces elasticus]KAK4978174.1 hypothetical protein LTR42_002552 [Elasticomyces elasticus]